MDNRHALRSVLPLMLVLAVAIVVAACSGSQGRTSEAGAVTPAPTATPSPLAMRPAPVDHTVIPVGHAPHRVTAAAGAVWVAGGTGSVYRVAAGAGTARLVRDTGRQLTEVTAVAGRVFAGDNRGSRLLVLDAVTGRELRALRMPGPVRGVLAGMGAVWVTAGSAVVRVDPATLRVDSVTEIGGEAAQMALSGRSVVVSNRALGTLVQLDDHGQLGGTADVDGPTIGLVVTGSRIFAARSDRPGVAMLSRERFAFVGDVELPGMSYGAAAVGDEVWLTLVDQDALVRLSDAGMVLGLVQVGRQPLGIAAAGGSVWVANEGDGSLWRMPVGAPTVGT